MNVFPTTHTVAFHDKVPNRYRQLRSTQLSSKRKVRINELRFFDVRACGDLPLEFSMSIENVFASTRPASLGIALQRRLRLLGAVLPHFPPAAMRKYSTIKPLRPEKAFWTRLLSICLPMELEGWRLDRLDDRHDALVKRLLRNLESIVYMDRAEVSEVRRTYIRVLGIIIYIAYRNLRRPLIPDLRP